MKLPLFFGVAKKALFYSLPLLTFFVLTSSLKAQNFIYAKGLTNSAPIGGNVIGRSIQVDNLGNTYVTGSFTAIADFDPGAGIVNLVSSGGTDIFIAKYDASGNYIYAKAIGSTLADYGYGIGIDASNNAYITGYFSGTVDFDPGAGTANLTSNSNSNDIFIAKYDASGNYLYANAMGSTMADIATGIAVDASGNTFVTGMFAGTVDFNPGAGTVNLISNTASSDIFVARYDASGNYVYAIAIGGTNADAGNGIAIDGSGNVYVTGNFGTTADFDPGPGTANLTNVGNNDIFVAKYSASGAYVYAGALGGTLVDIGYSIAVDGSGNAYVSGYFTGTADFDPGAGTANLVGVGGVDLFFAKYNASGNYVYAKAIGSISNEIGFGIAVDASGNAYLTGYFIATADFDPGTGTASLTGAGSNDIFIARYDASGNYVFAKALGNSGADIGYGIDIDGAGNIYTTGYFTSTVDFDPGIGVANLVLGGTGNNAYVLNLSNAGNYVLARQLGNYPNISLSEQGRSTAVDGSGNVYVTGSFTGTVDFDPGIGVANLTTASNDIFVAKYDASGNYVYAIALGGTSSDIGYGIAVDASGNVYVTGNFTATADFDPGPGIINLISNSSTTDIFFAKYDASGNYVYAKGMGGTGTDAGNAIAVDASGNVYITGNFTGTTDFDADAGVANLTSAGATDIFIAKYNASGNYLYAKAVAGTGSDGSYGLAIDGSGNVYVTGNFSLTADFDPGPGTANLTSAGSNDIFFAKYDASGIYVYAKRMGSSGIDFGYGIAVDGSGNAYVTGYFIGIADFDPGTGTANLTSAGNNDIYVAKYDASGNYIYATALGSANADVGYGIAVDGSGNTYLTGSFALAIDFDPGAGTANLTSAGSSDVFVAKYDASGTYVYAKAMGGTAADIGYGLAINGSGDVSFTGSFIGVADFNPGGGSANSTITSINSTDVFIAKYGATATLPVTLVSFVVEAVMNGEAVRVSWSTASQTNNAYFDVERSRDGIHFQAIGRRRGCFTCAGIQQYELMDNHPYRGLSYYRLKQADNDDKVSYGAVAKMNIADKANTSINVFPSITDGAYTITIKNTDPEKQVVIQLLNAAGGLIKQQTVRLTEGENTFNYSLSDQARGVYYVRVADKSNDTASAARVVRK